MAISNALLLTAPLICLASLVALAVALFMIAAAERRLRDAGAASQAVLTAGGKRIESAAKRMVLTQDEQLRDGEQSVALLGQAGARLTGMVRDAETRLRGLIEEVERRWRDIGSPSLLERRDALPLEELLGAIGPGVTSAVSLRLDAIDVRLAAIQAERVILDPAIASCLQDAVRALNVERARLDEASRVTHEEAARSGGTADWGPHMREMLAASADRLEETGRLVTALESALGQASAWPALTESLVRAAELMAQVRPSEGLAAPVREAIAHIVKAIAAQDRMALRMVEASSRTEEAARLALSVVRPPVSQEDVRPGHSLLAQAEALHDEAARLAASANQAGSAVPAVTEARIANLAADILRAMEELHAASAMLAASAQAVRRRSEDDCVRRG